MRFEGKRAAFLLLTVTAFLPGIAAVMPAGAELVGVVCVSDAGSSSCVSSPAPPGGDIGTLVEVAVNIQDAASINGFDIYVKTDPRILNPLRVELAGTVLGLNRFVAAQCINEIGFGCSTFATGPGVVRLAAVALGFATTAPTTGRMFSIIYNITSLVPGTVSFQTGCSPSSTASNACVLTVLGSEIVPVTIVPDTTGPGDFAFISVPDSQLVVPRGSFRRVSVTIASTGGFSGGVSLTVEITPRRGPFSPIAFFFVATPGVFLLPGTQVLLLVEVDAFRRSPLAEFTVTVTGTSGLVSHSASFSVQVSR